jgi:hypothetical protein
MKPPTLHRTLVLGLGHKARQGKDTVVRLLQAAYPGRIFRVSMADAMKAIARVEFGMTAKDGPLLQRLGTEVYKNGEPFRHRPKMPPDPDIWVRAIAWTIAELDADAIEPIVACIPDVRFPNEAEFVQSVGGVLARVTRLDGVGAPVIATDRPTTHISETALDDFPWPYTLQNRPGDQFIGGHLQAAARGLVRAHLCG